MRTDLSKSQQAVQSSHAVLEACRQSLIDHSVQHPNLVLCGVDNEDHLIEWMGKLKRSAIPIAIFREPDIGDSITAISTGLVARDCRKYFRGLKLLNL